MKRKDIKGYDRFYQIDVDGNVYSYRMAGRRRNQRGEAKLLKQGTHPFGHKIVSLWKNNEGKCFYVHRLVLETFIGKCPFGMQSRHIDNNPANNKLENLEWASISINQMDRVKFGTSNQGERCGTSKLTKEKVLKIRERYNTGKWTLQRLADVFRVCIATISDIIHRKTWGHV